MQVMNARRAAVRLLGTSVVIAGAVFGQAAMAQVDCSQINVSNCPTLFKEECRKPEFRAANVDACFDAVTDAAQDQAFCSDPAVNTCQPREECASLDDPVERHFCLAGQLSCKKSIPGLLGDYDSVIQGLQTSLSKYSDLTTLNLDTATSIDILCEFQIEQLNGLRSQAEAELTDFEASEDSIKAIDACSVTMQTFIDGGAPPELPEELWDQIARRLTDGMSQIQGKQGEIQSNIEALNDAPGKLKSLQVAFGLICDDPT